MEKTRVRDIMISPAIVAAPETTVPAAIGLMRRHNIRHLPVVENQRLVGIVSRGTCAKLRPGRLSTPILTSLTSPLAD